MRPTPGCFPALGIGRVFRAGGYGVQLFFVVSAATLMLASSRRREIDIRPFAVRRLARIAPLYYAGLVFYVAVHVMDDQRRAPLGVLLNLFFVHGFVPGFQNNVVPGGWSIGCEMTFYALFPLLFRWITTSQRAIGLFVFGLGVDTIMLTVDRASHWTILSDSNLYNHPVFQLPVFAAGIATYRLTQDRPLAQGSQRWLRHGISGVGLLGVVGVALVAIRQDHQAWQTLPVALFTGMLVYGCVSAPPRFLVHPFLVRLGLISYSMYIWHFAVLFGVLRYLSVVQNHGTTSSMLLAFGLTVLLTWPIAELSRRFVELPGIALGRRILNSLQTRSAARPA